MNSQRNAGAPMNLMTFREVCSKTRLSRSAVYANIARGEFPKPAHIGGRAMFDAAEVDTWIQARFDARYGLGEKPSHAQGARP
ncbi:MAG: helix-turn-helix transcriptional regulator [Rhodanobacteraceae bacterium]